MGNEKRSRTEEKQFKKNLSDLHNGINTFKKEVNKNDILTGGAKKEVEECLVQFSQMVDKSKNLKTETIEYVTDEVRQFEMSVASGVEKVASGDLSDEKLHKDISKYKKKIIPEIKKEARYKNIGLSNGKE